MFFCFSFFSSFLRGEGAVQGVGKSGYPCLVFFSASSVISGPSLVVMHSLSARERLLDSLIPQTILVPFPQCYARDCL